MLLHTKHLELDSFFAPEKLQQNTLSIHHVPGVGQVPGDRLFLEWVICITENTLSFAHCLVQFLNPRPPKPHDDQVL